MKHEYIITYELTYEDKKKERTKRFSQLFRFENIINSADLLTLLSKLKLQFTDLPPIKNITPLMIHYFGEITDDKN